MVFIVIVGVYEVWVHSKHSNFINYKSVKPISSLPLGDKTRKIDKKGTSFFTFFVGITFSQYDIFSALNISIDNPIGIS